MRFFTGPKPSQLDESNYVEIYSWPQSRRNVAGHISMKLVCDGQEYYISYWHQRDYRQSEQDRLRTQYDGVEPFWVDSHEEDCLIEGYRHFSEESPKQNAKVILFSIRDMSFKNQLAPEQSIRLNSLNVRAIRDAFLAYQKSSHKWASFSGTQFHAEGAYNCSSLVLHLLIIGGIEKIASSHGECLRYAGLVASLITLPFLEMGLIQAAAYILLSGAAGAFLGGGIDGVLDIQNFLRVIDIQKGKFLVTRMGLTTLAFFISAIGSVLTFPNMIGKILTLPDQVMSIVHSAYNYERQNYTPDSDPHSYFQYS